MNNTLSSLLKAAQAETGCSMDDLTVLANQRDPYRLGTKSHQRNAEWLAECIAGLGITEPIHLRGLHYRLVGSVALPDGKPYINNDRNWTFMADQAAVSARFLGTVPFGRIIDNRNAPPTIFTPEASPPATMLSSAFMFNIPSADELAPEPILAGNLARQKYRLAVVGEKSGLADLIAPICRSYEATLALPNGEISTTMIERLIADASADGRPLAVFYLADCDPAGHQMAVSFARKAQAIIDLAFPDVRLRVHAIALTPEQSREWELPSTPLKETEKRADRWFEAMGVEQTEIDAAIVRAPDALTATLREALDAYTDQTIHKQAREAKYRWQAEAIDALESQLGADALETMAQQVGKKLETLADLAAEIEAETRIDPDELGVILPPAPEPIIGTATGGSLEYLIDSAEGYAITTRKLIARKAYTTATVPRCFGGSDQ